MPPTCGNGAIVGVQGSELRLAGRRYVIAGANLLKQAARRPTWAFQAPLAPGLACCASELDRLKPGDLARCIENRKIVLSVARGTQNTVRILTPQYQYQPIPYAILTPYAIRVWG
jgi:hypothetical protein